VKIAKFGNLFYFYFFKSLNMFKLHSISFQFIVHAHPMLFCNQTLRFACKMRSSQDASHWHGCQCAWVGCHPSACDVESRCPFYTTHTHWKRHQSCVPLYSYTQRSHAGHFLVLQVRRFNSFACCSSLQAYYLWLEHPSDIRFGNVASYIFVGTS